MITKFARKKHQRRTAQEIDKEFVCPYADCSKIFGSEGSQNLHIKIKHNGGSKTERERLAKALVNAYANNCLTDEIIDSVDLNLPPGIITKIAKKTGVAHKVDEAKLLEIINRGVLPKLMNI